MLPFSSVFSTILTFLLLVMVTCTRLTGEVSVSVRRNAGGTLNTDDGLVSLRSIRAFTYAGASFLLPPHYFPYIFRIYFQGVLEKPSNETRLEHCSINQLTIDSTVLLVPSWVFCFQKIIGSLVIFLRGDIKNVLPSENTALGR
jgi:hypothetical protein